MERPLFPPSGVPLFEYPLSLGAATGAAVFLPAGRLAGGAGGVGLPLVAVAPLGSPFVLPVVGAGGGGGREAATGGGGGGTCFNSSRYAAGVHPEAE